MQKTYKDWLSVYEAPLSEPDIFAYLMEWIFEVGANTVTWVADEKIYSSEWYGEHCIAATRPELRAFFDFDIAAGPDNEAGGNIKINQRGLDFIKNYEEK